MRARSLLLLVSLLALGGGTWCWFVLRATRTSLPLAPATSTPAPQVTPAAEPLDSPAEVQAELPVGEQLATRSALADAPGALAQRKGAASLRGFVLGEDDAPVQVFDLELVHDGFFSSETASRHVESPDGLFDVEALTPGTWKIQVHAPAMVMKEPGFSVQLPHEPLLLRMRRTACVSGLVLDDGGTPVNYADVRAIIVRAGAPEERTSVQSDTEGRFRFEDLAAGEWAFIASPHQHEAPSDPVRKTLALGDAVEGLTLRLKSGGTIVGDVSPECLANYVGRDVNLVNGLGLDLHRDVAIGTDGLFRFDHVTPGKWWIFVDGAKDAPGTGPLALAADVVVLEGQTAQVHLGLSTPDSVRVHGRVLRRGSPVPGIQVAAFLDGVSALQSLRLVQSDAEGRYELALRACGQATFFVGADALDMNSGAIHVRIPCVHEHTLDLSCTSSSAELRGTVLDAAGKPFGERGVRTRSIDCENLCPGKPNWKEAQSDANGCFAITGLRPGTYLIFGDGLAHEVLARQLVRLGEGEVAEGLVLRFVAPGSVRGVVRTADGSPCAGLEVYARLASGELLQPTLATETGPDGSFAIGELAPGRYTFFARGQPQELTGRGPLAAADCAAVEVLAAQSEADAPSASVRLVAVPAGFVRVELRDAEGFSKPASVRILDEAGRDVGCAVGRSDPDDALDHGAFGYRSRFGPLPPGRYTLEARTEGEHVARQAFTLAGELEKQLSLRVE